MKTVLFLFALLSTGVTAEDETGFFGPTDQPHSPEVVVITTDSSWVSWKREKSGKSNYQFGAGGVTKSVTQEEFTKCYHLATKAIREYRRSAWAQGPKHEIRQLSINRLHDNILLSYEAGALKENPALAELLVALEGLAKTR